MTAGAYEDQRILAEYLLFHYGKRDEILPYPFGPVEAFGYASRTVSECLDPDALPSGASALDLGCAVGRSTFELARHCASVIGIDFSERFIAVANELREHGSLEYTVAEEGELTARFRAEIPPDIDPSRIEFRVGDAMELPADLGPFDVVHLSNLIDRLREPRRCLERLPRLVRPGGQLILTSPYTWLEEFTPKRHWLGGYREGDRPVRTLNAIHDLLSDSFVLKETKDLPLLIREHARKFQWSVAQASVWRRGKL